jgi:hypothetical protein
VGVDEWREVSGGERIVEDVFTENEIGGVQKERSVDVERWTA